MSELSQIKVVAEKLRSLRAFRDAEKKKFDEEVKILANVRKQINTEKEKLQKMYKQAGISIPKI